MGRLDKGSRRYPRLPVSLMYFLSPSACWVENGLRWAKVELGKLVVQGRGMLCDQV